MANDGRKVIGEVSVKVKPDTTGFARETKRRLQAIKGLDREKYRVPVEIDTEQLTAKLRTEVAKLNAKAITDSSLHVKLRSKLEWSTREAREQIKDAVARYQTLAEGNRVEFDTGLKGADRDGLTFKPRLDTAELDKAIDRVRQEVDKEIDLNFDTEQAEESVKRVGETFQKTLQRLFDKKKIAAGIEIKRNDLEKIEKLIEDSVEKQGLQAIGLDKIDKEIQKATEEVARYKREWERAIKAQSYMRKNGVKGWSDFNDRIAEAHSQVRRLNLEIEDLNRRRSFAASNLELTKLSTNKVRNQYDELKSSIESDEVEIDVRLSQLAASVVRAELLEMTRDRIKTIYVRIAGAPAVQRFFGRTEKAASKIGESIAKWSAQIIGVRLLFRTALDLMEIVPKLDMMIPQIAKMMAVVLGGIAAASVGLTGLIAIGGDLMSIANLALMLPTVLGAVALSAGIVARAMKDFKKELPDVVSQFQELGDIASSSYWDSARDGIRGLWQSLKPLLDARIPQIADALGRATTSLANGIERGAQSHLDEFFENMLRGLEEGATGFDQLGEAMMRLVGVGSRRLPDLGKWFSEQMTSFNGWVDENDRNGNLERWIREGEQALRDLGSVIWSTGSMLRSLGRIASNAGLPSLTEFAEAMRGAADAMKGERFQDIATQGLDQLLFFFEEIAEKAGPAFVKALENAWLQVGAAAERMATPVANAIATILDAFNSDRFQQNLTEFTDGIATFIEEITPGLGEITEAFGGMLGLIGTAASSWGPAFNELLGIIAGLGDAIDPGLKDFIENTGPNLQRVLEDLKGPAIGAAEALGGLFGDENFQDFVNGLVSAVGNLIGVLLLLVPPIVRVVRGFMAWRAAQPEWVQWLIDHLLALALVLPGVGVAARVVLGPLGKVGSVLSAVGRAALALNRGLGALGKALLRFGTGRGLLGLIPRLLGRVLLAGTGPAGWAALIASIIRPIDVANLADVVVDALGLGDTFVGRFTESLKGKVKGAFGGKSLFGIFWEDLAGIFTNFFAGDWEGSLRSLVETLIPQLNFVDIIADAILNALGLSDEEIAARRGALSKVWNEEGLSGIFDILWEAFKTGLSALWDGFVEKVKNWKPIATIIDWGKKIWDWVKGLFGGKEGEAGATARAVMGDPKDGFIARKWEELKNWLKESWDGLVEKVKNWNPIATVIDWGKKIWGWIRDFLFGPQLGNESDPEDMIGSNPFKRAWDSLVRWLRDEWDKLVNRIRNWEPVATVIDLLAMILGWLAKLFIPGAFDISTIFGADNPFVRAWTGFKEWAGKEWNRLVAKIKAWKPAEVEFNAGDWVWGKVKDLFSAGVSLPGLGGGGEGGFSLLDYWPSLESGLGKAVDELRGKIKGYKPTKGGVDMFSLAEGWIFGSNGNRVGSGFDWSSWGETIAEQMANGLRNGAPSVIDEAESLVADVADSLASKGDLIASARASARSGRSSTGTAGAGGVHIGSIVFQAAPGMSIEEQVAYTNAALGSNLNL